MIFSSLIRDAFGKKHFCSAVLLAAGTGTRFGSEDGIAKQFVSVDGVPAVVRSALEFQNSEFIDEIVVVTGCTDLEGMKSLLDSHGITKLTKVVRGGDTRQESAKRGFDAVNPACEYVAIHDAVRCLITTANIEAVFEAAIASGKEGSAACAHRVVDTVKRTNGADVVSETVDRENLWVVQTPQVFAADVYRAASYMAVRDKYTGTDDCSLAERLGFKVRMVECGWENIKITYPEDIRLAEAILEMRAKNENRSRI